MQVIPLGLDFGFKIFLKYVLCMLVLGFVGGYLGKLGFSWSPRQVRSFLMTIGIIAGVLSGIYLGAVLNS